MSLPLFPPMSAKTGFIVGVILSMTLLGAAHEIRAVSARPASAAGCSTSFGKKAPLFAAEVPADSAKGVVTPAFAGKVRLVVTGTFAYNDSGSRSDGIELWVGDTRMSNQRNADHRYCLKVDARDKPLTLVVRDSRYQDNHGSLSVTVLPAD